MNRRTRLCLMAMGAAVKSMHCSVAGDLLVGETGNWRVQRVRVRPMQ